MRLDDGRDTEFPDKLWILGKSPLSTRATWRTGDGTGMGDGDFKLLGALGA